MNIRRVTSLFFLLAINTVVFCQQKYPIQKADILKYIIDIQVNDDNNKIKVIENIHVQFSTRIDTFYLDLSNINGGTTGMNVSRVLEQGVPVSFFHKKNRLGILVVPPLKNIPFFETDCITQCLFIRFT